jgi:hypothetical protein
MPPISEGMLNEIQSKIKAAIVYMERQKSFIQTQNAAFPGLAYNEKFLEYVRYVNSKLDTYLTKYDKFKSAMAYKSDSLTQHAKDLAHELNNFATTQHACELQKEQFVHHGPQPLSGEELYGFSFSVLFMALAFFIFIAAGAFVIFALVNASESDYIIATWQALMAILFFLCGALCVAAHWVNAAKARSSRVVQSKFIGQ